ncbi:MAG: hypothetical protein KAW09_10365, partial [Thermoplasmata archaeon]|nr:hypothetical protein [Thermoplasmata archaeon]
MRIQLATPYKLPGTVGGISSYVETLRYSLSRAGVDVAVARKIDISSDVIHCHAHWYVLRDSLKRKKISGFTFHTIPELSYLKWKAFTKLLDRCEFLIHLSDYSLQEISRSTGLDGHVIRPSVLPKFLPMEDVEELKTKLKLDSKHPILCMISPLEHKEKCEGMKSLLASLKLIESQGDPHLL